MLRGQSFNACGGMVRKKYGGWNFQTLEGDEVFFRARFLTFLTSPNRGYFTTPNIAYFTTPNIGYFTTPNIGYFTTQNIGYFTTPNIGYFVATHTGYGYIWVQIFDTRHYWKEMNCFQSWEGVENVFPGYIPNVF